MAVDANALRRAQTEALIAQKPSAVVLSRRPKVSDGAGGTVKEVAIDLAPQTFRLVPADPVTNDSGARVNSLGKQVTPTWLLIGLPEQDMERDDRCTVLGHLLEIVYVSNVPTERLVGECWEYGNE